METQSYDLTVLDVVEETEEAKSLSLAVPPGAEEAFVYRPGQFLTVAVPSEQTGVAARCYSLSSSPLGGGPLTITVKRTQGGYASNWICDQVKPGDTIRVLPPSGIFTPKDLDADLLLFAGGSGITPVISIARTALADGANKVVLFYANRDERSVIFARELAALSARHPQRFLVVHWLESVQGLPAQEQLQAFAAMFSTYDAFVCGPAPFMKAAVGALKQLGFPRERRHQEKFISLGGNPFGDLHDVKDAESEIALAESEDEDEDKDKDKDRDEDEDDDAASTVLGADASGAPAAGGPADGLVRLEVELDGEHHVFDDWTPGTSLLDFLVSKGVKAPYSCREGDCSACMVRILEGEVELARNDVLDEHDLADGIRLGCQAVPVTDVVRVSYG